MAEIDPTPYSQIHQEIFCLFYSNVSASQKKLETINIPQNQFNLKSLSLNKVLMLISNYVFPLIKI